MLQFNLFIPKFMKDKKSSSSVNILEEDPEEFIDQRNMRFDQFITESDTLPLEPRIITLYRGFTLVHHGHPCPENPESKKFQIFAIFRELMNSNRVVNMCVHE